MLVFQCLDMFVVRFENSVFLSFKLFSRLYFFVSFFHRRRRFGIRLNTRLTGEERKRKQKERKITKFEHQQHAAAVKTNKVHKKCGGRVKAAIIRFVARVERTLISILV